jgi:hypothetical protein
LVSVSQRPVLRPGLSELRDVVLSPTLVCGARGGLACVTALSGLGPVEGAGGSGAGVLALALPPLPEFSPMLEPDWICAEATLDSASIAMPKRRRFMLLLS